ncbi:hypothetical protein Ancab_023368 [Ancistrocladus abbreviatus]
METMASQPHVLLFPFMSKGHTIPLLHLTRLLLRHRPQSIITIFTTPSNKPFILNSLSDLLVSTFNISIIELPFPQDVPDVPNGIESTDKLPSISLFLPFATATKLLQPHFETALKNLPKQHGFTFLVSDGFLYWTQQSASKFNIPRLAFTGMSNYAAALSRIVVQTGLFSGPESDDTPFEIPDFPWIKLTRNDFDYPFNQRDPRGAHLDFIMEVGMAMIMSCGTLVNSFYELEPRFFDYMNTNFGPKAYCIGPLCLAEKAKFEAPQKPTWIAWLDKKLEQGKAVMYIAFGTQAEISNEQLREITIGLEKSGVEFLWVIREKIGQEEIIDGFERRVVKNEGRGLVVREWVEQRWILGHESVKGFLSHCGWNSVMESICAKVPILAWPMMADQHLNARMVVEEIRVGLRVVTSNGSVKGFVKWEGLEKVVKELMEGDLGKEVREKVKKVGEMASKAIQDGGSSHRTLDLLLQELEVTVT